MRKLKLLVCLITSLISLQSYADPVFLFKDKTQTVKIGSVVGLLEDPKTTFTFNEVKASTKFVFPGDDAPNLGISEKTYWAKFTIKNETSEKDIILQLDHPTIDILDLYTPDSNGVYNRIKSGEQVPYYEREIDNQNFLFYLDIPQGEQRTYYMMISSGEQILLPLTVGTQKVVFEELIVKDLVFGLYIGIILVMAIYNLFIYFTVRDKSYIYYVAYILSVGLTQAVLQGYGFKYLWPNSNWLVVQSTFLVPIINGLTAITFVKIFLNTKENWRRGHNIMNFFFWLYVVCIFISLANEFYYAQNLIQFTAMIGSVMTIFVAYRINKQGYRPALYFLVAWTIFLISVVVFVLRNYSMLPNNALTYYALQIGSALEVTLLSFALADKINIYRKEKEESQAEALRVSIENENIIREQNVVLEVKVEERTRELNQSNIDLNNALIELKNAQTKLVDAEKMASLGQLTAGIAHEINNPINFVSSNIMPLRRDIDDIKLLIDKYSELVESLNMKEQFREIETVKKEIDYDYLIHEIDVLLKGMADGAGRTVEIVKGLKSFSRLDESDLKYANVNEGIDSTLIILNSTFKGKVTVIKEFGQIPEIECYSGKLNQVFLNIINNAAQAVMSNHEHDNEGKVTITTSQREKSVEIRIADNGTGMTEEVKSKIFDPFFTTKKAGEGTGLGLSIVFSIIELHSGTIRVESELGVGTVFIITLPITQF